MKFSIEEVKKLVNKETIGNWVVKYKRLVAVGCIVLCVAVAAIFSAGGKTQETEDGVQTTAADAESAVAVETEEAEEAVVEEETNELEKDAYAEVNEIVQKYYEYMSAGDMEGYASVVDEVSEEEQNRILRSKDLVEGYQNISCYTKKGLEENSYLVFVYYELKFVEIDTPAPGLSPIYVYTNEEGNLTIFNGEAGEELLAYAELMSQEEDVMALRQEVANKYEEAKTIDENLAKREELYVRVASEENAVEGESAEAAAAEGEGEAAEGEAGESEAETPETEAPAQTGEATAQNRTTRFKEAVRLRAQATTESEQVGTAYQGESVTQIESYIDGWSKINYNGKECYCKTEFLE